MKSCSFSSLEQCQASVSGTDGDCSLDPYTKDTSIATINRNAYAYAPLSTHGKRAQKGSAATKR